MSIAAMILWAAAEPDWTALGQYGVLGIILLLMIFGKIVPGPIYDNRVKEHEADKAELRDLQEVLKERVIPALVKSTDAQTEMNRYLEEQRRDAEIRAATQQRAGQQGGS